MPTGLIALAAFLLGLGCGIGLSCLAQFSVPPELPRSIHNGEDR